MSNLLRPRLVQRLTIVPARNYYFKFERRFVPPLQEKKESPFIVGPHLKPDYIEQKYITEPIAPRNWDEMDHYIYDPIKIEPDESRTVKLLLIDDVEGLGVAGQIVDAPYRYGASKLIAMKKAEYATEFAVNWYKFGPKSFQSASSALSPRTIRFLKAETFKLPLKPDTKVEPWHISLALRLAGCVCPVEAVEKDSIVDYIENDREHVKCTIVINNHEKVEVRFYLDPLVKE